MRNPESIKAKKADIEYEKRRVKERRDALLKIDPVTCMDRRYIIRYRVLDRLKYKDGERILECGSGTCEISEWLQVQGHNVIAMDLCYELLAVSKERSKIRNQEKSNYGNLQYIVGDCEYSPFKDRVFDKIICYNILHHLPDVQGGIQEIYRILKIGGECLVVEPNALNPKRRIREFRVRRKEGIQERSFYPWVLPRMFKQVGFDVTKYRLTDIYEQIYTPKGFIRSILHRLLSSGMLEQVLGGIMLISKKR
jgi:ubiquinone/menaquinone biosynthesis C-methylase UbiE